MMETTLCRQLPPVSARATLLLAGTGLVAIMIGLFAGAALLLPAGIAGLAGLLMGLSRWRLVSRGRGYLREGRFTLLAATFVNGSLALYVAMAAFIVLRFGV